MGASRAVAGEISLVDSGRLKYVDYCPDRRRLNRSRLDLWTPGQRRLQYSDFSSEGEKRRGIRVRCRVNHACAPKRLRAARMSGSISQGECQYHRML